MPAAAAVSWNAPPDNVVLASSINSFRHQLKLFCSGNLNVVSNLVDLTEYIVLIRCTSGQYTKKATDHLLVDLIAFLTNLLTYLHRTPRRKCTR